MKKGFTLIELLVVIAIIGILASIVLVSLGGARDRAKDARIISDMGQMRTVAVIYEGNNNTYADLCIDGEIGRLRDDATATAQGGTNYSCSADAATFCAKITLNNNENWCVDSALVSEQGKTCSGTTPWVCQ